MTRLGQAPMKQLENLVLIDNGTELVITTGKTDSPGRL